MVAAEDLLRHAVDAAEVAAVGDRDAQVAQRPAERVEHVHRNDSGSSDACWNRHRCAALAVLVVVTAVWGVHVRPGQGRGRALSALRVLRVRFALGSRRARARRPAAGAEPRAIRHSGCVSGGSAPRRRLPLADRRARADDRLGDRLHHRDADGADAVARAAALPRTHRRGRLVRGRAGDRRAGAARRRAPRLGRRGPARARGRGRLRAADRADGDAGRRATTRSRSRSSRLRRRARLRRDRRARGELHVPHGWTVWGALIVTGLFATRSRSWRRRGRSGGRRRRARRSRSRSSPSGRRSSASRCAATARRAWLGCAVIMAGIVSRSPVDRDRRSCAEVA